MTLYTSSQVCRFTGVTYRQLDEWLRMGLVWPARPSHGSGHSRGFDADDVVWIQIVARLVGLGVRPGVIAAHHGSADELRDWCLDLASAAIACEQGLPEVVGLEVSA